MSADAEAVRTALGLPAAPLVNHGLEIACGFFRTVIHEDPTRWIDYLRGIDFHQSVHVDTLPPGTPLAQHQHADGARHKPFVYFTKPGVSPTATGTTFDRVQFMLYETAHPTVALVSKASPISFNDMRQGRFDPVSRAGGGVQYIIAARDMPPPVRAGLRR